jgi:GDP-L-fucose synthase
MQKTIYEIAGKRVWVAGHRGMVGSALMRRLASEDCELITADRGSVDLRRQQETEAWLAETKPDLVYLAAAKVGGILANRDRPGEFLYDNLMIEANVMEAARRTGVGKLVMLGSSCIYPKFAPQPITEDALLTGPLEPTNEWYAVAKIAGIKMAQAYRQQYGCDFICLQPSNLYGPNDNFDPETSHVIAALLRRFHEAKLANAPDVVVWGTGTPRREFLHVDDLADACVFLTKTYSAPEIVNIGTGEDLSIAELARLVAETVDYRDAITFDTTKPDGTPRKLLDVSRLSAMGWNTKITLREGLRLYYRDYLAAPTPNAVGKVA